MIQDLKVKVVSFSMITALGFDVDAQMERILNSESGLSTTHPWAIQYESPLGLIDWNEVEKRWSSLAPKVDATPFEKIAILSANEAIQKAKIDPTSSETLLVFSTTKGNIGLLGSPQTKRIHLWETAGFISGFFKNPNVPVVISNACVSGVLALNFAADQLRLGIYKNAVVIGADQLSHFVLSGFKSFKSLSDSACKPFDQNRNGLNLGEAAAAMVLSSERQALVELLFGASHNDANHISGPSRTAEGMYYAVQDALALSKLQPHQIQSISVHGTATPFNDEMESIGLQRLQMSDIPIHALKSYWGHSLGAVGLVESIALIESMKRQIALPTLGYETLGVSSAVKIHQQAEPLKIQYALKVASGFSGVNAALIFKTEDAV